MSNPAVILSRLLNRGIRVINDFPTCLNDWKQSACARPLGSFAQSTTTKIPAMSSRSLGIVLLATFLVSGLQLNAQQSVVSWGGNFSGQLGDGTTTQRNTPVLVSDFTTVIAVAAGTSHSLSLKSDGTAWAWGANDKGQLGNGSTAQSNTPVQVSGLSGVIALAAGGAHSLALKSDGTVWQWGENGARDSVYVGAPSQWNSPVQVTGLTGVIAIASGNRHSLALKNDGTVWVWGFNIRGQLGNGSNDESLGPIQVTALSGVTAIAAGGNHSLAVTASGEVWTWGSNSSGQLGNGTTNDSYTPVQATGLSSVSAVAGGAEHSLALKNDGTLYAWGLNGSGQLGDGSVTQRSSPVPAGITSVTAVAAGGYHSLAIKRDGTVYSWGYNGYGELGTGNTLNARNPIQVANLAGATSISGGFYHSLTAGSIRYSVQASAGFGGTIAVTPSSADNTYPKDATLKVEATPNSGYHFTGFSGDLSGTTNPQSLLVDANKNVYANFAPNLVATNTTLTVKPGTPSTYGQSVTLQAGVTAGAAGLVNFYDGATLLGSATLSSGSATLSTAVLNAGKHSLLARFTSSDTSAYTSSDSSTFAYFVEKVTTTTTIAVAQGTLSTVPYGTSVTFNAAVRSVTGAAVSGSVAFQEGATVLGTAVLSGGSAMFSTTQLLPGSHTITAVYQGDTSNNNFLTSISTPGAVQGISKLFGLVLLVSSTETADLGANVTFTASVKLGVATGTMEFFDGQTSLGSAILTSGLATISTSTLTTGSHSITAVYSGDAIFTGSSSPTLIQAINNTPAGTNVNTTPANPVTGKLITGNSLMFTNVSTAGITTLTTQTGAPSGNLALPANYQLGTPASYINLSTTSVNSGSIRVCLSYAGVAYTNQSNLTLLHYNAATNPAQWEPVANQVIDPVQQTVCGTVTSLSAFALVENKGTTTTVTSSKNPSAYTEAVTFTATVIPSAGSGAALNGSVQFYDGPAGTGTALGTPVTLTGGIAQLSSNSLTGGSHIVTATYQPAAYYLASSGTVAQTVNPIDQSISFTGPSAATYGDASLNLTASANSGLTVSFSALGNCSVAGATLTITGAGSCTITASQSGNSNYNVAPNVQRSFNIAKASPVLNWASPVAIVFGTPLTATQLNASASFRSGALPGTFIYSPAAGTVLQAGAQVLKVTFNPSDTANFNSVQSSTNLLVTPLAVQATVQVAPAAGSSLQYSDKVILTATLPVVAGLSPATGITFQVAGQSLAATLNVSNGILTATATSGQLLVAPNTYPVTIQFSGVTSNYTLSAPPINVNVNQEDARPTYTGALFASTSSATSGTAAVTLSATIQDITAAAGDAAADSFAGDITKATVTFVNRDAANAVLCTAPIGLVTAGDNKTGTATCNWSANIGNQNSQSFTVGVIVDGYYSRNVSADNAVVTVSKPLTGSIITGGGYLKLTNSAGLEAGDVGTRNNFGFNVKYNGGGTNLQGSINTS